MEFTEEEESHISEKCAFMSKMLDYSREKAKIGIKLSCTESSNKIGLVKAHYSPTHWLPPFELSLN